MEQPIIIKVPKTPEELKRRQLQLWRAKQEAKQHPASPQTQLAAALFNFGYNVLAWALGEDGPFKNIVEEWDKNEAAYLEEQKKATANGTQSPEKKN